MTVKRRSLCDGCLNQEHCLIMTRYLECAEYDPVDCDEREE